ncbi:MAG: hypothetical protein CMN79_03275 [Spirochaetales bacterium]|jgi:uncharacterized repeat protein (TIGR04076 family)|nr:hypothetical protein [Spirochaetales bacterium]|tara:strand:+ start:145 stop:750 length:606 start_codon:yes stop_codon:yes gene_type:complete
MKCKYCIDEYDFSVKVAEIETKCKYHKETNQIYNASSVAPKGLCRELFYAAYPECLAALYSGLPEKKRFRQKGTDRMVVVCPAINGVKVLIKAEEILPKPLGKLKELVEEFCKKFYKAFDVPFRKVFIEIIEAGDGCHKDYRIGDIFEFNINKNDELCPAGFATIYPYLRFLKNSNKGKEGSSIMVHCPDYVGVTYEVTIK